MLKCFFLSPWKLVAAAFARFCTGKLPSTNWNVGRGSSPAGTNTEMCSAWGGAKWHNPLMLQLCNCQSWSVCLFRDPSSTWQCSTAHESTFSHLRWVIHFITWNNNKKSTFISWVIQEVPNHYQIQISPSSCRLHGTKQKYSTIFLFCTDIKITMACWKT